MGQSIWKLALEALSHVGCYGESQSGSGQEYQPQLDGRDCSIEIDQAPDSCGQYNFTMAWDGQRVKVLI